MPKSEAFIQVQESILKELEPVFSEEEFKRIMRYFTLGVQAGRAAQIIDEMEKNQVNTELKNV